MKCEHERSCAYEACYCPLPGCDFDASCKDLYRHFAREHQASATHFAFDSPFLVHLSEDMKFIFLQERDHTLFILNYSVQNNGNVANIICVGPSCLQNEYSHKLAASSANGGIKVTYSSTQSLTKWMVCIPKNSALVVPKELIDSSQHQQIKVCIRRKRWKMTSKQFSQFSSHYHGACFLISEFKVYIEDRNPQRVIALFPTNPLLKF